MNDPLNFLANQNWNRMTIISSILDPTDKQRDELRIRNEIHNLWDTSQNDKIVELLLKVNEFYRTIP